MPNRLAGSSSPYLLQHRDNPVDWYPWGEEAFEAAREDDRPILLSIGYAACHWCHVMERESFEDEATAGYMNGHFIPVKVDREERPDLDAIYMEAVQSITGTGGWPLTVFLDPEGVPFHGGTYFPPEPVAGMPSFRQVMEAVVRAWAEKRAEIRDQAAGVRTRLGAIALISPREGDLDPDDVAGLTSELAGLVDREHGGFGSAPKFPPPSALDFLLGQGEAQPVELTLDRMAAGGIHDQIGGGFARYSVDSEWLVPHFEKMLSDNALLARSYVHGYQELGHRRYRRIAEQTLDWALREMRDPAGGFHSSLDADSDGGEGRFYTWTPDELAEVLGDRAAAAAVAFGVTREGNFEGRSVLHVPSGVPRTELGDLAAIGADLLAAREDRPRPACDDKVLCSWNALMISALAEAGAVLGRDDYVDAATACATFIWDGMRDPQGNLRRSWRAGSSSLNAYLEDYAFLLEALLELYQATFDPAWFERARGLAESMIDRFSDPDRGGFFTTSHDHERLIARRKDVGDHPIPSGNASAALGLLRLHGLTGERRYLRQAESVLKLLAPAIPRQPDAFGHLLQALALYHSGTVELALVTPPRNTAGTSTGYGDFLAAARERYRPGVVIAAGPEGTTVPALLSGRTAVNGQAAAYVCRQFSCRAPVTAAGDLGSALVPDG